MKTLSIFILAAILFASPCLLEAVDQVSGPYVPAEGDKWYFTVEQSGGGQARSLGISRSTSFPGQYIVEFKASKLNYIRIIDGVEYEAHPENAELLSHIFSFAGNARKYFKFPMQVGDEWPISYEYISMGRPRPVKVEGKNHVVGFKDITLGDKQLKTVELKIEGSIIPPVGEPTPMETNIFYSPETGTAAKVLLINNTKGPGVKTEITLTKFIRAQGGLK